MRRRETLMSDVAIVLIVGTLIEWYFQVILFRESGWPPAARVEA